MQLAALFRTDFLKSYHWFKANTTAKTTVVLGFLTLIIAVLIAEYYLTYYYFQFINQQEDFALPIIQYSLNASIFLIFILSISSSTSSTYINFFKATNIAHLLTTPISLTKIIIQKFLITAIPSAFISLLLIPLFLSANVQTNSANYIYTIIILITLVFTAHAIGTILTLTITSVIPQKSTILHKYAWIFIIIGFMVIIRFIFPPAFKSLYFAPDLASFQERYQSLPIVSPLIPTNWWSYALFNQVKYIPLILTTTISLVALSIFFTKRLFLSSWRKYQTGVIASTQSIKQPKKSKHFPQIFNNKYISLLSNEFLAILRTPADINYISFLVGILFILLIMIRSVPSLRYISPNFIPYLIMISWMGLTHIFLLLAARVYYPSISRIKKAIWFQFSIPITPTTYLYIKSIQILLISLLSIPLALIAAAFLQINFLIYATLMYLVTSAIGLTQLYWGIIAPNFNESDNPAAASTSGSGLIALLQSLILLAIGGYCVLLWSTHSLNPQTSLVAILTVITLFLVPLYYWANKNIQYYQV